MLAVVQLVRPHTAELSQSARVSGLSTRQWRSPPTNWHPNTHVITTRWVRDSHQPVILRMCVSRWCGWWWVAGWVFICVAMDDVWWLKMCEDRGEGGDVGGKEPTLIYNDLKYFLFLKNEGRWEREKASESFCVCSAAEFGNCSKVSLAD